MLNRDRKGIKNPLIKILEMRSIKYEIKNKLDGINGRTYITEEKISKLEVITLETVKNKMHRNIVWKEMNRPLVIYKKKL